MPTCLPTKSVYVVDAANNRCELLKPNDYIPETAENGHHLLIVLSAALGITKDTKICSLEFSVTVYAGYVVVPTNQSNFPLTAQFNFRYLTSAVSAFSLSVTMLTQR